MRSRHGMLAPGTPLRAPLNQSREGALYEVTVTPAMADADELVALNDETGVAFNHLDRTPDGRLSILEFVGPARSLTLTPGYQLGSHHQVVAYVETAPPPEPEPEPEQPQRFPTPEREEPKTSWGPWLVGGLVVAGLVYVVTADD